MPDTIKARDIHIQFDIQLHKLESTMRKFNLWQQDPIAIDSITNPFGVGQISFVQWLQFVYLPRMSDIVDSKLAIPSACMMPYAQEVLTDGEADSALLTCIKSLDNLSSKANE